MGNLLELTALAEPNHFWFHGLRPYVTPVIDEIAGHRRDLRIIDCGCGTGYNLDVLLRPYGQTFAFDLNEDSMWRARRTGRPGPLRRVTDASSFMPTTRRSPRARAASR